MKKNLYSLFFSLMMLLSSINSFGQVDQIRQSQKSSITQYVGANTQITINYSRPAVKGRVIWGEAYPTCINKNDNAIMGCQKINLLIKGGYNNDK